MNTKSFEEQVVGHFSPAARRLRALFLWDPVCGGIHVGALLIMVSSEERTIRQVPGIPRISLDILAKLPFQVRCGFPMRTNHLLNE
ncbi:MAG: hypothetical protein OWU84_13985 [Firmicutes bacterium]|nr:hypothetical protein [Bacillota bacterium]